MLAQSVLSLIQQQKQQNINKSSLNLALFPSDPAPPSYKELNHQNSFAPINDSNSKEKIKNQDLIRHNTLIENNSIGELDRNMKTLADSYKIKSNGSLAFSNRSFHSLSNSNNQNNR